MKYDKLNVKAFRTGEGRLICNICEQATTVDDSISSKGFHLICNECACKICSVLGMTFGQVVIALHSTANNMSTVNAHGLDREQIRKEQA